MRRTPLAALMVVALLIAPARAADEGAGTGVVTLGELYKAKALVLPAMEERYPITPEQVTAGFRPTRGVRNLRREGAGIAFDVTENEAAIAWGNIDGTQPLDERIHLWPGSFEMRFSCRQSGEEECRMTLRFRNDGRIQRTVRPEEQTLTGTEMQEIVFQRSATKWLDATSPDAFQIAITGAAGRTLEIHDMSFVRSRHAGAFRKEFTLPDKEIWSAPATIGNMTQLRINGLPVEDPSPVLKRPVYGGAEMYRTKTADLAAYLRPGRNCIGVHGWRNGGYPPYLSLQCKVIFMDGTSMRFDSDETWRWTRNAPEDWSKPGFDDADWDSVVGDREALKTGDAVAWPHWVMRYKGAWDRPADEGRMRLHNAFDQRLYYPDDRPVIVGVRIPGGLAGQAPAIRWELLKYEHPDKLVPVTASGANAEGVQAEAFPRGRSLSLGLDLGRLQRGVYTLQTKLLLNGEVVETRIREPLVVYGRLEMDSAPGTSYESGMDLVHEQTIDYTKPNTYEWLEVDGKTLPPRRFYDHEAAEKAPVTEPLIVRRNGLAYRATRPNRNAQFSIRLTFDHPGDWYLMVLEYPDDKERWMGASCTSRRRGETSYSRLGPAVITGFKFPVSNQMRKLRWLYRPDSGSHVVNVINIKPGSAAAAARLRVYHVRNGLPEMAGYRDGARHVGILTENDNPFNGFGVTFGVVREGETGEALRQWERARLDTDPVMAMCKRLSWNLETSEAYAQYLRWTGENVSVIGVWQYTDRNNVLAPDWGMDMARLSADLRDTAVRVLSANGLSVVGSIEFCNQLDLTTRFGGYNDGQVALGAETPLLVDRHGRQLKSHWGNLNFLHPEVAEAMLSVGEDVAEKWRDVPGFMGVNYTAYLGGNFSIPTLWPQTQYYVMGEFEPLGATYDDVTIRRFEKETGMDVPGEIGDPERFAKRYAFLTGDAMRDRWITWRCETMRDFWREVRRRLRRKRPDLNLFASLYFDVTHARIWKDSGLSLHDFLRQFGWDPALYRGEDGIWCTHWMHAASLRYRRTRNDSGYVTAWEMMSDPEPYALYARGDQRAQMIMHHWQEMERAAFAMPEREGWAYPYQSTLQAHATGPYAREPFTHGLIGGDPQFVMWGFSHVSRMVGHEQPMRDYIRVLRALPEQKLEAVADTGFETNLALRACTDGETTWLLAANPAYWAVSGSVALSGVESAADLVTGAPVTLRQAEGRRVLPVRLGPFGVAAWKLTGDGASVVDWEAAPSDRDDLVHVRNQIEAARQLLGDADAAGRISEDDRAWLGETARQAATDLEQGREARAWAAVTNWRYWMLLHGEMDQSKQ